MSNSWEHQPYPQMAVGGVCDICRIVANEAPSRVAYQDDDVMVIYNMLQWVPVMLLIIPKKHMTQKEMWHSQIIGRLAEAAVRMGTEHCPGGFRIWASSHAEPASRSSARCGRHAIGPIRLGEYPPGYGSRLRILWRISGGIYWSRTRALLLEMVLRHRAILRA